MYLFILPMKFGFDENRALKLKINILIFFFIILFLFIKLTQIQRHPSVALGTLRDIAMEVKKGATNIKQDSTTDVQ